MSKLVHVLVVLLVELRCTSGLNSLKSAVHFEELFRPLRNSKGSDDKHFNLLSGSIIKRRTFGTATAAWLTSIFLLPADASVVHEDVVSSDFNRMRAGLIQLTYVIDNWDSLTLNCKYAEVNKDLLGSSRKSDLLEAASSSALFNKNGDTTRTLCKRDSEVIRYVFGLGGEKNQKSGPPAMFSEGGIYDTRNSPRPLFGIEPVIKRGFESAGDGSEEYLDAMERWGVAKAGLSANSYASGVADFASINGAVNGVSTTSEANNGGSSYLETSRRYAIAAQTALGDMVALIEKAGNGD